MNTQIRPINQTTFHILYFRYKIYLVPAGALIVAFLLLTQVIFPQVQQWYANQDKIAGIEGNIATLNQSINTINSMDTKKLEANLQVATTALPSGKDFAGILDAISQAAQESGTGLGDYTFQVGDLGSSTSKTPQDTSLQITVSLNGNLDHIQQFVAAIHNQFPISKVTEVHLSGNKTATIIMQFYYKPIPNIAFTGDQVLQPLTDKEQSILSTLKQAASSTPALQQTDTTSASGSGSVLQ